MIIITIPRKNISLVNDLSEEILQDICYRIYKVINFQVQYEDRRTGRYIKVTDDATGELHIVCLSNPHNNSRNSHLMQFVSPTYIEYFNNNARNKHMDVYLIDQSANDRTDYIKLFYKCFMNIKINVLNLEGFDVSEPFYSYEQLKSYRKHTSERNSRNRSTYFTDDDNQISVYGKTFGANAMESFIFGLTIKALTNKKVVFYPVIDNNSENLSKEQIEVLKESGISFGSIIKLSPNGYAAPTRETSRNQSVFKYNLLQKFGDQQCYLCGCDIEHLIIASHIERVTDIDKNSLYTTAQKAERSTDSDNGLWLCASHDKMFEFGIIYFDDSSLKVRSYITNNDQQEYILKSIFDLRKVYFHELESEVFTIKAEHYTGKMQQYLSKHLERHSLIV